VCKKDILRIANRIRNADKNVVALNMMGSGKTANNMERENLSIKKGMYMMENERTISIMGKEDLLIKRIILYMKENLSKICFRDKEN